MAAVMASPVLRIPARQLVSQEQLAVLRRRVEWKAVGLIVHAWAVILGAIAMVAVLPNPLTYVLAVMLIGSRQLGLAILMHDGAHGCFSRNEAWNMILSQWFCAWPIFADALAYRRYHLAITPIPSRRTTPTLCCRRRFRLRGQATVENSGATSQAGPAFPNGRRNHGGPIPCYGSFRS
jgi:Fatty acid desaturase